MVIQRNIYNFRQILDRTASTMFRDYRMDNLYKVDEDAFYEFLSGFLINGVDIFNGCLTSLDWHEEIINGKNMGVFDNPLSSKEVHILCLGVLAGWWEMNKNDITEFNNHLNTRDFKSYSGTANLKAKSDDLDKIYERIPYEITQYQLSNFSSLPFFGGV